MTLILANTSDSGQFLLANANGLGSFNLAKSVPPVVSYAYNVIEAASSTCGAAQRAVTIYSDSSTWVVNANIYLDPSLTIPWTQGYNNVYAYYIIYNSQVYGAGGGKIVFNLGGCVSGGCFTSGTKIKLFNGLTISIEDVKAGDEILTFNFVTNQNEKSVVTNLETTYHDSVITHTLSDNRNIISSFIHPFYVLGKGLSSLDPLAHSILYPDEPLYNKLESNDILISDDNSQYALKDIKYDVIYNTKMYNLFINGNQNYYANGILVGN